MRGQALLLLALSGCGRFGFGDATADAGGSEAVADAAEPNLLAHYGMEDDPSDGDLGDLGPGGHRALCGIGVSCGTQVPGKVGRGLRLVPPAFYRIPFVPALQTAGAFSVAVWVKPTGTSDTMIVTKRYSAIHNTWGVELFGNRPQFQSAYTAGGTVSSDYLTTATPIAIGAWSHLAITWDGASRRVYVNGFRIVTDTPLHPPESDTHELLIGCDDDDGLGPFGFFDGTIDEVRIYDRALSDAEILTLGTP